MRSPPTAPQGFDVDVYVVLDDFGKLGRAYREIDEEAADKETVIRHLMEGQYNDPVRIVAFNTAEGWARDVTEDIATEIRDRVEHSRDELSPGLRDFLDHEVGRSQRLASLYQRP
jgi:lysyl-tRNA synthetase class I